MTTFFFLVIFVMQRKYTWLPEHESQMEKIFDHKASEALSNAMHRVRTKVDQGSWIPQEIRQQLEQRWSQDEWKAKSKINSNNRKFADGPVHTGGSIPATEHYKRLVRDFYVKFYIC